jgi:hypothetical protein
VVEEPSNHTVSVVYCEGPALEWEITQAMTYSQRLAAKGRSIVPVGKSAPSLP